MSARPATFYPAGMGYLLFGAILLILLAGFFAAMAAWSKKPRGRQPTDHPVEFAQPASDEPTPGASNTAKPEQVQKAQERTPPS